MTRAEAKRLLDLGYIYVVFDIRDERIVGKYKTISLAQRKVDNGRGVLDIRRLMHYLFPDEVVNG